MEIIILTGREREAALRRMEEVRAEIEAYAKKVGANSLEGLVLGQTTAVSEVDED